MAVKADKYFKTVAKNLTKQLDSANNAVLQQMFDDTDLYVPHDTGATRRLNSRIDQNKRSIIWENEYIEFIFWGIDFDFQKANNPQAQAMWTDVSATRHSANWADIYADIIESAF